MIAIANLATAIQETVFAHSAKVDTLIHWQEPAKQNKAALIAILARAMCSWVSVLHVYLGTL